MGQEEVLRRDHLIQLAKSIKTKRSIFTFLKNDRFQLNVYPIIPKLGQLLKSKGELTETIYRLRNSLPNLLPYIIKIYRKRI